MPHQEGPVLVSPCWGWVGGCREEREQGGALPRLCFFSNHSAMWMLLLSRGHIARISGAMFKASVGIP